MTERKNYLHPTDEVLRKQTELVGEDGEKNKVLTNDRALDEACNGGEFFVLDEKAMKQLQESGKHHLALLHEEFPKIVEACPEVVRLAIACQVMKALFDHGREGGSFRHLIYSRLGFSEGAYTPLHLSGGTAIVNHLDLSNYDESEEMLASLRRLGLDEESIAKLKEKIREQ